MMSAAANSVVLPGGSVRGAARVPGDKSISHRAVMLGSLADGVSEVSGFLNGEDSLNTLRAFQAMGVSIEQPAADRLRISGVGMRGLTAPTGDLYMGNAGTGMRLIAGLLAAQPFDTRLTGDESLASRPMGRVIQPLALMGAHLRAEPGGRPPLIISGGRSLNAIDYTLPMASAQVKSAVLLAGLYAEGNTRVVQPAITRDHTERMLQAFGWPVETDGNTVSLTGGGCLAPASIEIPADISSAAFFLVAASIAADSDLILKKVGINPSRRGVLDILALMGADIELLNETTLGAEPVADIRVRSSELHGIEVPPELVPLAIDELPVLFVAAACANGETTVSGAAELRVKESDRIAAMAVGLSAMGVELQTRDDGILINGIGSKAMLGGADIETYFDHRIAMSFAVAALRASAPVIIHDSVHIDTSFPGFFELCAELGWGLDGHV